MSPSTTIIIAGSPLTSYPSSLRYTSEVFHIIEGWSDAYGGTTVSAGTLQGNTGSLQGDILNISIVEFNQAADGTYAGVMSGTEELHKSIHYNADLANDEKAHALMAGLEYTW